MKLKLSNKTRKELRKILAKDIGPDRTAQFPQEDLDDLGHRLLRLTAVALKHKARK